GFRETDFVYAHFLLQEFNDFADFRRAGRPFDARVDVLRVFPENDHVDQIGPLYRRRDPVEIADRPATNVQVQFLAERHVQGADAAAHGRRQRTLDGDDQFADRRQGVLRQPFAIGVEGFFAGENFIPGDLAVAFVRL